MLIVKHLQYGYWKVPRRAGRPPRAPSAERGSQIAINFYLFHFKV